MIHLNDNSGRARSAMNAAGNLKAMHRRVGSDVARFRRAPHPDRLEYAIKAAMVVQSAVTTTSTRRRYCKIR
jgi:hypothetical protein